MYFNKNLIEMMLTTNALKTPTARTPISVEVMPTPLTIIFIVFSKPHPSMTGIARKKVYSVAATREHPESMPPMMVDPDLEVPGTIAKH